VKLIEQRPGYPLPNDNSKNPRDCLFSVRQNMKKYKRSLPRSSEPADGWAQAQF